MKTPRHRAREFALQGLYQWLLSAGDPLAIVKQLREARDFVQADDTMFKMLLLGTIGAAEDLTVMLTPLLDRRFPFDRALDAHVYLETERHTGKVVVDVNAAPIL